MRSSYDTPSVITIPRRGLMLVLSSPSGAGKSTIARNLLESDPTFALSVSVTTRKKRASEIEGVHYHFVTPAEFERLRSSDALLEWAEVHGNLYGTPREPAELAMRAGRDMLFDIDWQGARQLQEKAKADIVSVFILPPSMQELKARLLRRAEDSRDTIATRMKNAKLEIERWSDYDYVVVNDDLDRAFQAVRSIVAAERLRRDRRPGLFDFVSSLLSEEGEGLAVGTSETVR
ncbi:guanylate kinase [Mangrovibrevibacter kandeliae]|uniref:guanylate kinase n=1 Tax=Mangrovibrevibacter kandeliae TaxID=2968473 RepID=UPI00211772E2|nr:MULTISPECIES: guanylate kinase [unclassified Aurantimonas]MCQ8781378.1 guanylate kinase [Aurantimonas sp. CSK15Z-1]MCW4114159.1 guanylate kinase [Aurantimonas sp. MSK8Z-1]